METSLKKLAPHLTWRDAPVECAAMFTHRVNRYMKDHLMGGTRKLGDIQRYVVRILPRCAAPPAARGAPLR